jgi:hypothetical protein
MSFFAVNQTAATSPRKPFNSEGRLLRSKTRIPFIMVGSDSQNSDKKSNVSVGLVSQLDCIM